METIFINTENSKTNEYKFFFCFFSDKLSLKNPNKSITWINLSIYYAWKNIKSAYNNNNFKIFAPTFNDEFDLPDGSYSVSDILDYLEYIMKKLETVADNSPIQIYIINSKDRVVSKIATGYKLELLSKDTMKLLESIEKAIANANKVKIRNFRRYVITL